MNLLSGKTTQAALGSFVDALGSMWEDSWGPRSDYYTRNCGAAVMRYEQRPTILHFFKFFTNAAYRKRLMETETDPIVQGFFSELESLSERDRAQFMAAPLNKTDSFLNPVARCIIGQYESLDMRKVMDERKILLCPFAEDVLGPDVPAYLGAGILHRILEDALGRTEQDPVFRLYVDEFHKFYRGRASERILSETRKKNIEFTIADQTKAQLPKGAEEAILGNITNLMVGRVGVLDAPSLSKALGLDSDTWLMRLSRGQWMIKTQIGGVTTDPMQTDFTFRADVVKNVCLPEDVIRQSERHHGRPRTEVEDYINRVLAPVRAAPPQNERKERKNLVLEEIKGGQQWQRR